MEPQPPADQPAAPPAPTAPPTVAPPPPAAPAPAWPVALGVVAIVFGALGALGAVLGLLAVILQDAWLGLFAGMIPEDAAAEMAASGPHPGVTAALQIVSLAVAALLLIAGVRLAQRRRQGARLLRLWALIKIPLVLVGAVVGAQMGVAQSQAMQTAGAGAPPPGFQMSMMVMSIAVALLWGWALPVFSLVWLRREKVQADMADWPL